MLNVQVYLLILSCLYFFISILIVIRSCMLGFFQVQSASTVPEPKAAETVNVDMTWYDMTAVFRFWVLEKHYSHIDLKKEKRDKVELFYFILLKTYQIIQCTLNCNIAFVSTRWPYDYIYFITQLYIPANWFFLLTK